MVATGSPDNERFDNLIKFSIFGNKSPFFKPQNSTFYGGSENPLTHVFPAFLIRLTLKNRYDISLTFLEEILFFSWRI